LSFGCLQKLWKSVIQQREFQKLYEFSSNCFPSFLYRSGNVGIQPYNEPSITVTVNHSDLYNSMIYPFTRIVIYGIIWYQGKQNNFGILFRYS
jgi:hypothetical protein